MKIRMSRNPQSPHRGLPLVLAILGVFALPYSRAVAGPSVRRTEVIALMEKVFDYQIAHPWPFDARKNNDWERSTFYIGVMAAYRATHSPRYLDQARNWAEGNHWAIGFRPDPPADAMTCGQTYLELYRLEHDPRMLADLRRFVDSRMAVGERGRAEWSYIDALFVAPPTLAGLAAATGEPKYLDYMNRMYWDAADPLYDPEAGLFYRDATYISPRTRNGQKVFWSRGNGWVIAGIPRILEYLPSHDARHAAYVNRLKTMAAALAKLQQPDGLWRASLLDAEEFPAPETSGSAFFCYALAWGAHHGYLSRREYLPVVEKAWQGLVRSVNAEGKLGWVQGENRQPGAVSSGDTQEYGVGAFLLAGSEVTVLAR
jgi:rhamnogalacturonyl hydrolase YesR